MIKLLVIWNIHNSIGFWFLVQKLVYYGHSALLLTYIHESLEEPEDTKEH